MTRWNAAAFPIITAITFASAAGSSGCELKSCHSAGCVDTLQLKVFPEPSAATYRLEFILDGEQQSCTIDATETNLGLNGYANGECSTKRAEVSLTSRSTAQHCVDDRCVNAYDGPSYIGLSLYATPDELPVSIIRSDVEARTIVLTPSYTDQYPNGADCTGHCRTATATVDLRTAK